MFYEKYKKYKKNTFKKKKILIWKRKPNSIQCSFQYVIIEKLK